MAYPQSMDGRQAVIMETKRTHTKNLYCAKRGLALSGFLRGNSSSSRQKNGQRAWSNNNRQCNTIYSSTNVRSSKPVQTNGNANQFKANCKETKFVFLQHSIIVVRLYSFLVKDQQRYHSRLRIDSEYYIELMFRNKS